MILNSKLISALLISGFFLSAPVLAEKPAWAGQGHGAKQTHQEERDRNDNDRHDRNDHVYSGGNDLNVHVDVYFGDHDRVVVHDYYEERYSRGFCPPGLAKKHNGCMPPGQARKWEVGHPLPRDVIYHDLPPRVIVELRRPPVGHKYVRVAADILLIVVGTGVVVDAIEDLGRVMH